MRNVKKNQTKENKNQKKRIKPKTNKQKMQCEQKRKATTNNIKFLIKLNNKFRFVLKQTNLFWLFSRKNIPYHTIFEATATRAIHTPMAILINHVNYYRN